MTWHDRKLPYHDDEHSSAVIAARRAETLASSGVQPRPANEEHAKPDRDDWLLTSKVPIDGRQHWRFPDTPPPASR